MKGHLATTLFYATDQQHLDEQLAKYQRELEVINPHSNVILKVSPDPATLTTFMQQSFAVSVYLEPKEKGKS